MEPISTDNTFPKLEKKVQEIVPLRYERQKFGDLIKGLGRSPTIQTLAVSILFTGCSLVILLVNAPSWVVVACIVSSFGVGLVVGLELQLTFVDKGKQKFEFEYSMLRRMLAQQDYHQVFEVGNSKIFLGALPNRLVNDAKYLFYTEKVEAFLSLNELWEVTQPNGLVLPYTEIDYQGLDNKIILKRILAEDHVPLNIDQLNEAADFIDQQVKEEKNIYVHCRAGVGRSAMGIAAYLMKYQNFTVNEACQLIKEKRPRSSIYKKRDALMAYQAHLIEDNSKKDNNKVIEKMDEMAEYLYHSSEIIGNEFPFIGRVAHALKYKENKDSPSIFCDSKLNDGSRLKWIYQTYQKYCLAKRLKSQEAAQKDERNNELNQIFPVSKK
ncbi:MAG: dual specificity protein phosphatase [Chlamydiales bacterium]